MHSSAVCAHGTSIWGHSQQLHTRVRSVVDTLSRTLICSQALVSLCCTYLQPCCLYSAGPNITLWFKADRMRKSRVTASQCDWLPDFELLYLPECYPIRWLNPQEQSKGGRIGGGGCSISAFQLPLIALEYRNKSERDCRGGRPILSHHIDGFNPQIKLHSPPSHRFNGGCYGGRYATVSEQQSKTAEKWELLIFGRTAPLHCNHRIEWSLQRASLSLLFGVCIIYTAVGTETQRALPYDTLLLCWQRWDNRIASALIWLFMLYLPFLALGCCSLAYQSA